MNFSPPVFNFQKLEINYFNDSLCFIQLIVTYVRFCSADLRSLVDFMYTGFVRTPVRRYRLLRQAATTLGVGRLVETIDDELTFNAEQCPSSSYNSQGNSSKEFVF